MRKSAWLTAVLILAMIMALGAGTAAWAGPYTSQADLNKVKAIDQRAVAEKEAIAKKYAQADLERQVTAKAMAVKPAVAEDRGLPSPVKTAFLTPFVTVGTCMMALGEGFNYVTSSKFETPVSQVCRAGNTAKSQLLFHPYNVVTEFVTGFGFFGKTQYYDPSKLNYLGKMAQKRGPVAQMVEMAATVAPPVCVAAIPTGTVLGWTLAQTAAGTGVVSAVGSVPLAEAVNYGEKNYLK